MRAKCIARRTGTDAGMASHVYNDDFYAYISQGSRASANVVIPLMLSNIDIDSVLDVGAGNGSWLAAWLDAGVADALAVDGDYVDRTKLAIPADRFQPHDLARPLDLGRRFGLVQSLEVAEHLAEDRADSFVETLARHGDVVMFSAAVRNQGGEYHVNEQPPEYWRRKFAARGYTCFDWLRPQLVNHGEVKPWYRFNTLIYANEAGQKRLSQSILEARVAEGSEVPMCGNLAWNARRAAVALIPQGLIHTVAMAKAAIEARTRGHRA